MGLSSYLEDSGILWVPNLFSFEAHINIKEGFPACGPIVLLQIQYFRTGPHYTNKSYHDEAYTYFIYYAFIRKIQFNLCLGGLGILVCCGRQVLKLLQVETQCRLRRCFSN